MLYWPLEVMIVSISVEPANLQNTHEGASEGELVRDLQNYFYLLLVYSYNPVRTHIDKTSN